MKAELESATNFSTQALERLREHFIIIRTPPDEHRTQGGVLVPIDPGCPRHDGAACWSGRRLAWFWIGTFGHPDHFARDVSGLFVHRYTGRINSGAGQPRTEEEEIFKVFDTESLDAFLRASLEGA